VEKVFKMKKILFLIHTLGGGGAEKVLVNLANGLDKSKYEVTVMTVIDTGIFREALDKSVQYKTMIKVPKQKGTSGSLLGKKSKVKRLFIDFYTLFWRWIPTNLVYRLFIREKYDVEIAFLEGICAKIISGSKNPDSKKLVWVHVDLINQHKSAGIFKNLHEEKVVYNKFNQIVCVSEFVKKQFLELFEISPEKVCVKYNAIDSLEIRDKSKFVPENEIVKKEKFTFCSVGRLNAQKSFGRLLQCHKHLIEDGYNVALWLIGEGTDYENLKKYVDDNQLNDSVVFLGFQRNPYYYMKQADVFVCSSVAEGFSTVATEATVLGIPIVTTDCSGMVELLGDNEYGIITENNVDALYQGMKNLLDDRDKYNLYKKQSAKRGLTFIKEQAIHEIEKIL